MLYLFEAAKLLLPGLGTGFLIASLAHGFSQPWWTMGLICAAVGALINLVPVKSAGGFLARKTMLKKLSAVMPWIAVAAVAITLIVRFVP